MTTTVPPSLECYVEKLERRAPLPAAERAAFLSLPSSIILAEHHEVVAREGSVAERCLFLMSGFITRQKTCGNNRQIVAIGIPGDAVDLQSLWFHEQDHSVVSHGKATLVGVAHADVAGLCARYPRLAKVLWHDSLVDAAIFRQWTLNIGHRRAKLRIAHLFLELEERLKQQHIMRDEEFELPFSQSEYASMTGLSLVHLNKSLRALREDGFIITNGRTIHIQDREKLTSVAGFDPDYLHLTRSPNLCNGEAAKLS